MNLFKKATTPVLAALLAGGFSAAINADDHASVSEAIQQAVANTERPEKDQARDSQRLPAEVLSFLEIAPGQDVLEMYSGGGYYTELVARVVGESGSVTAHNNAAYAGMTAEERATRYADGRLANVTELAETDGSLSLPADAFDRVLFILSYHDVYYLDGQRGWIKVDRETMLKEVFEATRKGGIVGVLDHVTAPDAPVESLPNLHRIDPALVKADFEAAGFVLAGSSDILANPQDDVYVMPMLPTNRGKSDRFVLKFSKP